MAILHTDTVLGGIGYYHGLALADYFSEGDWFGGQGQFSRFDQRQVQNLIDEFKQEPSSLENLLYAAGLGV